MPARGCSFLYLTGTLVTGRWIRGSAPRPDRSRARRALRSKPAASALADAMKLLTVLPTANRCSKVPHRACLRAMSTSQIARSERKTMNTARSNKAGCVTCSNCHEPHSLKLRAEGNLVCAQCHLPAKFDTTAHHHHEPGSAGAQCVNCHMPMRTYRVVDVRRDHAIRVPRPDLSVALSVPNACNNCHTEHTSSMGSRSCNGLVRPKSPGRASFWLDDRCRPKRTARCRYIPDE